MTQGPANIRLLDAAQLQLVCDLAEAVSRADDPEEIYRAAVERLSGAVSDRASVMTFDAEGVMRFKAWKGVSARHRGVMEGKLSWRRGDRDAQVVTIPDVAREPSISAFLPTLELEGIRAIALIPLMGSGGLIGKFVLYYDNPHEFQEEELHLARTIAAHVAFAAERQLAATALRESQERYREVFVNTAEGIFLVDVTPDERFKFLEFNPVVETITGFSSTEVSGRFVEDVLPQPRATTVIANYRRCLQAGTPIAYEEELRLPVGRRYFHVHLSPVRNGDGRFHRIVGVARDITERRQADAELRESEERFRTMADSAPVMIWVAGPDRRPTFFNKCFLEFTGKTMPETISSGWQAELHEEDKDWFLGVFSSSIDAKREFRVVARLRRADGEYRWILYTGVPRFVQGDVYAGHIGSCIDITDQKLTEERLRTNQVQFNEAQRLAQVGSWEFDLETNTSHRSDEMRRILGLPSDASQEFQLFIDHVHPEDRERVWETSRNVRTSVAPIVIEFRIIRPDAGIRHVRSIVEAIKNERGEAVRLVGATQDITEQIKARELLRESEQRLRMAQNAARLAGYSRNLATNEVTTFGEYAELYGVEPDQIPRTFEDWIGMIHPDDRDRVRALLRDSLQHGHDFDIEFRICWPDGSIRWICGRGAVYRDNTGRPVRTAGVNFDITERKRAEAALRESEERFRRVFEEGPLGLALVGRDYRFLKVNSALCRMLGYSEEELVEKTFSDITHPDDILMDVELAEQLFKGQTPFYRLQKRYVKKTGVVLWINLTASLLHGRDGASLQGLAMVEDITEVKRTQEETFVRRKLESVGTLANGIAHDFNNILGAVLAQAEVALAELSLGSDPHDELRAIRDAAMRGSEIVRELMIYAGNERDVPGLIDLSGCVKEMLALLRVSVSKHAVLSTDLDKQLPPVRANAAQVSQLVMNLVTNASEAIGDRDGVIRVTTQQVALGPEFTGIPDSVERDYVQLEISDTGRGMSPETQARVFDPFFSTKSASRGLGLAVVHGIVRGLGGTIHLASELGHGTTFLVLLPVADGGMKAVLRSVADVGPSDALSKASTILLVEDEESLRRAASKMFNKRGFSVIEARDGLGAMTAIRDRDNLIDVLLLDVTLPGTPAREVLEEARRLRPEMQVVVTSAYTEEMAVASLQTSIDRFIRKPYRLNDLVSMIQGKPG